MAITRAGIVPMREFVDVVVIGAGPAGMSAALEALEHGLTVTVLDEQGAPGGQVYRSVLRTDMRRLAVLGTDYEAGKSLAQAFAASAASYQPRASVWNIESKDNGHIVHFVQAERTRQLQARFVICCGGAQERPFPVPGWTLPGVMTAGAAQILLKQDNCVPFQPVLLVGCGPLLYLIGDQYRRAGVPIRGILDTTAANDYRQAMMPLLGALTKASSWNALHKGTQMLSGLRRARVPYWKNVTGIKIIAGVTKHESETERVAAVEFTANGQTHQIEAKLVLLHQGVVPNTQFSRLVKAEHRWVTPEDCWLPVTDGWGEIALTGIFLAGDGRGIVGASAAKLQGRLAAMGVASRMGRISLKQRDQLARPVWRALRSETALRAMLNTLYRPKRENLLPQDDVIVCRCEEITADEIRRAVALGCSGPNQMKAFTRCGMGPCQGVSCGLTATGIIADALKLSPEAIGAYRIRAPIKPVTLAEMARGHCQVTGAVE